MAPGDPEYKQVIREAVHVYREFLVEWNQMAKEVVGFDFQPGADFHADDRNTTWRFICEGLSERHLRGPP
jgi:hypothetical protein